MLAESRERVWACQGGELSSLPGTGPGCWGPFPTGTANGNAGSVSGALKPGAEPSAPVTTARLRGQRASPARRIRRPPDTRLLHRPTSEAAGSCDSQRRSGPRWRPALHPAGRPRCLWSPPPRGSRLRPPCRGRLCSAWGGSPAGTGQGRVSARWELGACRPCRCTVHAGRATWRAPDSVRSPGPALAPLPAQPPCHGDSLNHALPEHVGGQAWTALLPSASSLGITPPSHPAVAVGEPVPAKHRLPGPSASLGTGRHTGVGRWRRVGALPWGQPLSHVPSPWSRPGH